MIKKFESFQNSQTYEDVMSILTDLKDETNLRFDIHRALHTKNNGKILFKWNREYVESHPENCEDALEIVIHSVDSGVEKERLGGGGIPYLLHQPSDGKDLLKLEEALMHIQSIGVVEIYRRLVIGKQQILIIFKKELP